MSRTAIHFLPLNRNHCIQNACKKFEDPLKFSLVNCSLKSDYCGCFADWCHNFHTTSTICLLSSFERLVLFEWEIFVFISLGFKSKSLYSAKVNLRLLYKTFFSCVFIFSITLPLVLDIFLVLLHTVKFWQFTLYPKMGLPTPLDILPLLVGHRRGTQHSHIMLSTPPSAPVTVQKSAVKRIGTVAN